MAAMISTGEDKENANIDTDALRLELKTWEKEFVLAHGGRKPGREDIKKDPAIGAKYKLYQKLQRPSTVKPAPSATTPRKSRTLEPVGGRADRPVTIGTPRKTPSKSRHSASLQVPGQLQDNSIEATPAFIRRALGPTPQKDGQVLGIFDIALSATPSRPKDATAARREHEDDITAAASATPSRPTRSPEELILSRTPQSVGRKFLFDAFVGTPLKRTRDDDEEGDQEALDAGTVTKKRFTTPSFLRRSCPLSTNDGSGLEGTAGVPAPPFRKRGLVRSLSSIIKDLRKQEEERMDDEMDILRELEEEAEGIVRPKPAATKALAEPTETVGDDMPLGPDQAQESATKSEAETDGIPRKPWKKKGLKRQTRRVIMRPVLHKAKKAEELETVLEEDADVVHQTQLVDEQLAADLDGPYPDDDLLGSASISARQKASKVEKSSVKEKGATSKDDVKENDKGRRKISAQAHANFRKLKIKNRNSKANGRGRFGRR